MLLEKLVRLAEKYPGPIVEIGTLAGQTTQRLAAWALPTTTIYTVDNYSWNPWDLSPASHRSLVRSSLTYLTSTGRVVIVDMDKDEFTPPETPSLVFLDAIHTYVETKKDIEWAYRVGAQVICGHDYSKDFPGVMRVVNEYGGPRTLTGTLWSLT